MDSILKIVYSNWYNIKNDKYPFANGTTDEFTAWAKKQILDNNLTPAGDFDRISEFDKYYLNSESSIKYCFRNSNFYFHCKNTGIEFLSEHEISDNGIYLYPFEIESNTIHYLLQENGKYMFSCISETLLNHLRNGKVRILLVNMVDPSVVSSLLVEFKNILKNNGIDSFVTLQGNIEYNTGLNVPMFDSVLSLYQTANEMDRYPYTTSLGYVSDYVREQDLTDTIRSKKFLCFNRFMDRCHRTGMAYLALKYNLLDQGYFSFLYNNKNDYLDQLQLLNLPEEYAAPIQAMVPYQLDTQQLPINELNTFFTVTNYRKDLYQNSYIHIVTETQFKEDASPFMSEKTWRPILNLQPFIYLGNPLALNTLRTMGFKTFEPFIDESYDREIDPILRFNLIEKEIVKLNLLSIEEIHRWYLSIKDILIYNQKLLYSYKNYNPLCQLQNIN